ncbi:hypothetical protein MY10362_003273 [Beauveria mimosiformis]
MAIAREWFWSSATAWATKIVCYDKDKITRVVGVESNPHFRSEIEAQAAKTGFGDMYELVTCGAEEES